MLQYLLLLCALAIPGILALAVPVIEATAEDPKCLDIIHCRTLTNIVWSCLITIFACTWVSIHHNVVLGSKSGINFAALWERVWVTALTLLVPEYTLAWAVRQWLMARIIAGQLNIATYSFRGKFEREEREEVEKKEESEVEVDEKKEESKVEVDEEKEESQVVGFWTKFTRTAVSFCETHGGKPHRPVSREDLEVIIQTKTFELPNKQDIDARSKSDAFSKTVTILQALWFAMQCIARAIQHLPITNLEIATLAYTTMAIQMNLFWMNKPLNVNFPIRLERVAGSEFQRIGNRSATAKVEEPRRAPIRSFVKAVVGTQDDEVHLSELRQVPTLYSGKPNEYLAQFANAIAMAVGAIFGAVHCTAWSFAFPSQAEKLLWRISAVITTAIPLFYVVFVILYTVAAHHIKRLVDSVIILSAVALPFYLVARAVLLVLTFTTLRDLPPAAYESIHWMSFIPHV
ncbi:hypothetical protein FIBSPDRAFT_836385 [Athelia psychrophila]|uniref:Uncharacterized protein n=1 Tax=Athelia psychrophila TaxID=1759441 RepID=A0A166B6X4_9AGAM|nr:hypothetical protein FIBSPDRAFT_836385 [Fibularhizoctonia sp. CBS 109695]